MKAKTLFLLLFSLFLYEKEPEPVKKVPGAGAGQKRTGSATLVIGTHGSGSNRAKIPQMLTIYFIL